MVDIRLHECACTFVIMYISVLNTCVRVLCTCVCVCVLCVLWNSSTQMNCSICDIHVFITFSLQM